MFCALWHPFGAACPAGRAAPRGCLSLGQGQLCWWQSHVLGTTCSPAVTTQLLQPGAAGCSWLARRQSNTEPASDVSDERKWRLQFCGLVCAPVRMSSRILNNHLDAGSLENVSAQSVVVLVLDTPTTGWLMASPGGWAVSSRDCPTPAELQGQHLDSPHRAQ